MIVLLHDIRSMHNVGSIFRTADAAGIEKIYLCGITPEPMDLFGHPRQQITKVSLGAENFISWEKVKSTSTLINKLKKEGYQIFAIEQSTDSTPYYLLPTTYYRNRKVALLLGNEVEGLPKPILSKCDKILEIPMRGKKESLNVAVAFGIVVFRLING